MQNLSVSLHTIIVKNLDHLHSSWVAVTLKEAGIDRESQEMLWLLTTMNVVQ